MRNRQIMLYAAASLSLGAAAAVRVQRPKAADVEAVTRAVTNTPRKESRQVMRAKLRAYDKRRNK